MSIDGDDDRTGDDTPTTGRRPDTRLPDTRRRVAVGVLGAAAVVGIGAYAITSHLSGDRSTAARDLAAPLPSSAPAATLSYPALPASAAASLAATSAAPTASEGKATAAAVPGTTPLSTPTISDATRKKIDAARSAAAKGGHPLQRPPTANAKELDAGATTTRNEQVAGGMLRITSAKASLAGDGDRALAADDGHAVGDDTCTQMFRFSASAAPRSVPNMVLCWRISDSRSVVVLGVGKTGKAPVAESTSAISEEWARLG